jgi:hypothetical protein
MRGVVRNAEGAREVLGLRRLVSSSTPHPTSLRSATFSRKGRRERRAVSAAAAVAGNAGRRSVSFSPCRRRFPEGADDGCCAEWEGARETRVLRRLVSSSLPLWLRGFMASRGLLTFQSAFRESAPYPSSVSALRVSRLRPWLRSTTVVFAPLLPDAACADAKKGLAIESNPIPDRFNERRRCCATVPTLNLVQDFGVVPKCERTWAFTCGGAQANFIASYCDRGQLLCLTNIVEHDRSISSSD